MRFGVISYFFNGDFNFFVTLLNLSLDLNVTTAVYFPFLISFVILKIALPLMLVLAVYCTFNNNTAFSGGAVYLSKAAANNTVDNCTFTGNNALSGGCILNNAQSTTVSNSRFANNQAADGADNISNAGNGTITVDNKTKQTSGEVVKITEMKVDSVNVVGTTATIRVNITALNGEVYTVIGNKTYYGNIVNGTEVI